MNKKLDKNSLNKYRSRLNIQRKYTERVNEEYINEYNVLCEMMKSSYYINAQEDHSLLENLNYIYQNKSLRTISMREYVQTIGSGVWQDGAVYTFLTDTQEHLGYDRNGLYMENKKLMLIILHNTTLIKHEDMYKHIQGDSIEYYSSFFEEFLGRHYGKESAIPIFKYTNMEYERLEMGKPYGIIMPYKVALESQQGLLTIDECLQNHLLIARSGGRKYLREFLHFLIQSNKGRIVEKNFIKFYHKHLKEPSLPINRAEGYFIAPFQSISSVLNQGIMTEASPRSKGLMFIYENNTKNTK